MTLTLVRLPDGESIGDAEYWEWCAWEAWRRYLCVEWNGDHDWMAELSTVEDGGQVSLFCVQCPAVLDDLWPDCSDLLCGEVDGIPVNASWSRSIVEYVAPVDVALHATPGHWSGPYYSEPEVWIEVSSRALIDGGGTQ